MSSKNYEADGYKHDLDSESSRTNCAFRIIGAVGARRKNIQITHVYHDIETK